MRMNFLMPKENFLAQSHSLLLSELFTNNEWRKIRAIKWAQTETNFALFHFNIDGRKGYYYLSL